MANLRLLLSSTWRKLSAVPRTTVQNRFAIRNLRLAILFMSEEFEKVRGVTELPLFPLPIVLFPGVPLPLHIFEPRYRQMLEDIGQTNNLFGLVYFDSSTSDRDVPTPG